MIVDAIEKTLTRKGIVIDGITISYNALLKSKRYKGALKTNSTHSRDDLSRWGKSGGRPKKIRR